jgi:hypothetical protein
MEQIQFDDNFQGVGFDPTAQVDYIPTLDRKNQRLNAADEAALAQVRRNNQVKVQNAKNAGKELEALSKLSGKLADLVGEVAKERAAEKEAEDTAEGFEMYLNGGLDMSSYNQTMGQAKQQYETATDVEADVLGDDGENYEASSAISKSTAFRNANVAKGFAMGAMQEYGTFMENAVDPTQFTDRASYLAARRQAMKEFFKRAGIAGLKPEFLAQSVYPSIAKTEARAASAWSKQYAIEDSAIRRQEATSVFGGDKDVATFLNSIRSTVDSNGKPLGYAGAWDVFDKRVVEMRKAGLLTAGDIETMKNQKIPGDKKGRTYGQLYKAKFINIERQVSAQARKDWNNSEADRKIEFQQAEQQLVDAFIDSSDTDGFTDAQIEDAIDTLRNKYGMESSELQTLLKNTVDAKTRKVQEEQIENLIAMNLLTPERLKKFDPKLQKKYMSTAQQQAKLSKDSDQFKEQEKAIKDMVERAASVTRDSASHPTVGLMIAHQQREFHRLVKKYAEGGSQNPAKEAFAEIYTNFQSAASAPGFVTPKDGYPSMIPKGNLGTKEAVEYRKRFLDTNMKSYGKAVLDMPDTLFTPEQLESMSQGYGEAGFKLDPQLDYIAQAQGVDPLTVLNRQRKANGMTELPPSPAIEVIQNELTPTQQRLLNQFKTPSRSARAFTSIAQYKPELVPQGYGSMVEEAAKKHGLEPSIVAGLIETESAWNPNAVSGAGAQGLAQFMPATAQEFGVIPFNPESAINGAAQYLKYLVDYFNGDLRLAIFAYNGGMGNIQRYGGPIPGNTENQEYYGKVIKAAGKYGYGKQSLQDPAVMRPSIASKLNG